MTQFFGNCTFHSTCGRRDVWNCGSVLGHAQINQNKNHLLLVIRKFLLFSLFSIRQLLTLHPLASENIFRNLRNCINRQLGSVWLEASFHDICGDKLKDKIVQFSRDFNHLNVQSHCYALKKCWRMKRALFTLLLVSSFLQIQSIQLVVTSNPCRWRHKLNSK